MISNHVQKKSKRIRKYRLVQGTIYCVQLTYFTLRYFNKGPPRDNVQSAVLLICIRKQQCIYAYITYVLTFEKQFRTTFDLPKSGRATSIRI